MLFTFGYQPRDRAGILTALRRHDIAVLFDARKHLGTRSNPDAATMRDWLPGEGIEFVHAHRLGGRRPKPADGHIESDFWWRVPSFANYAAHTRTEEFAQGYAELMAAAAVANVAVMCCEPVWWRCHRRMIADVAVAAGHTVYDIMPNDTASVHERNGWAELIG